MHDIFSTEPNVEETIQLNIRMIDGMLTGEIEFEVQILERTFILVLAG